MILSKVYEDAERRLERNEITLGEFERLVDIEVIEPKRGEWMRQGAFRECSRCGGKVIDSGFENFCSNCSADMRGIKDE